MLESKPPTTHCQVSTHANAFGVARTNGLSDKSASPAVLRVSVRSSPHNNPAPRDGIRLGDTIVVQTHVNESWGRELEHRWAAVEVAVTLEGLGQRTYVPLPVVAHTGRQQ